MISSYLEEEYELGPIVDVDGDLLKSLSCTTMNFKAQSNLSIVFLKSPHTLEEEEIPYLEKKFQVSPI